MDSIFWSARRWCRQEVDLVELVILQKNPQKFCIAGLNPALRASLEFNAI